VIVLDRLATTDAPIGGFELSEVPIGAPVQLACPEEFFLVRADSGCEPELLTLDRPLDDLHQLCARWYDEATPLLHATDDAGTVLNGPGAHLLGFLVQRGGSESIRADWSKR